MRLSTTEDFTIGITYKERTIQHMLINCLLHLHDLTPNQQKRNKQLCSQLAELNKAGNLYVIK